MSSGINLNAGINSTGYGIVATNILKELYIQKIPTTLWAIGEPSFKDDLVTLAWNAGLIRQDVYNNVEPSLRIWHQHDMGQRYSSRLNAGLTFFELDRLSNREVAHLNSLDILFVASKWAKEIVDSQCSVRCEVVPMGVDTNIFKATQSEKSKTDGIYRFFTTGKTEYRKGHDVLIKAFERAFTKDDKVELHIKWDNPFLGAAEKKDWVRLYKESVLGDKVFFHTTKSQNEVAQIMSECDCGIYPTRAEGFGLGILEAIACGKPVITTNYSAHIDFARMTKTKFINITNKEIAYDGRWFFGAGRWAEIGDPEIESIVWHMKDCYENKISYDPTYQKPLKIYNWKNTVQTILTHLEMTPTKTEEGNQES